MLLGTLCNVAGKIVALGTWFLLTPFILHHLGPNAFGIWTLVSAVVSYGSLLDLGIGSAIAKFVAEHRVRGRIEEARNLVATTFWLYAALGVVAFALSLAIAPALPLWFDVPTEERATTTSLMLLMGTALGFSMPCTTAAAALRGLQRYDLINAVSTFGALFAAAATIAVLTMGGGLLAMAAAHAATALATQCLQMWTLRRTAPELDLRWRHVRRDLLRPISGFSAPIFAVEVAGQLQSKTDSLVIGALMSVGSITPYAIALRLSETTRILTDQFMRLLLPLASELHAQDDPAGLRDLFTAATRMTLALTVLLGGTVVLLGKPILAVWVGREYSAYGHLVVLLTAAIAIDTSSWPAGAILRGMTRHRPLALMAIGSGVANLFLSIFLARRFGLAGVALGTLIPTAIEIPLFVMPYASRTIGVSARALLEEALLPVLFPAASLAIVLLLLQRAIEPTSLLVIATEATIGGATYLAVYFATGAQELEREMYRTIRASVRSATRASSS
jgi:O-antigen/teichoic acid export membrane protein